MTRRYRETPVSPLILDSPASRLTMWDDGGPGEFWMIVPRVSGQSYRKARDDALELIGEAMDAGLTPGEVRLA